MNAVTIPLSGTDHAEEPQQFLGEFVDAQWNEDSEGSASGAAFTVI